MKARKKVIYQISEESIFDLINLLIEMQTDSKITNQMAKLILLQLEDEDQTFDLIEMYTQIQKGQKHQGE